MVGVRRKLSAGRRLRTRSGRDGTAADGSVPGRGSGGLRLGINPGWSAPRRVCGWVSTLIGTPPESLRLGIKPD